MFLSSEIYAWTFDLIAGHLDMCQRPWQVIELIRDLRKEEYNSNQNTGEVSMNTEQIA